MLAAIKKNGLLQTVLTLLSFRLGDISQEVEEERQGEVQGHVLVVECQGKQDSGRHILLVIDEQDRPRSQTQTNAVVSAGEEPR